MALVFAKREVTKIFSLSIEKNGLKNKNNSKRTTMNNNYYGIAYVMVQYYV